MRNRPSPNNRALGNGDAVLKITFPELLRSGSRVRNSQWQADLRALAEPSDLPIQRNEITTGELLRWSPSNDTGGISWIGIELKETGNR